MFLLFNSLRKNKLTDIIWCLHEKRADANASKKLTELVEHGTFNDFIHKFSGAI